MWPQIKEKIISKIPKKEFYFASQLTSDQMFSQMMDFLNHFAKVLGCDTFSVNYTPINLGFICVILLFILVSVEHVYWLYINRNDTMEIMLLLISLSHIPQGAIRIYSFIIRRENLLDVFGQMKEFHQKYYTPITKKVMEESVLRSCNLCLLLSIITVGGGALVALYPVATYYSTGDYKILSRI
jgi:hypothetical protein